MATGAPLREGERGNAAEGEPRDPLSISPEVKANLSLLIVDDDRTLREGCASVLQMDGFNVTTLGRGDEAIDLVKRRRFDIVLVDLYMTPVSGMEILKATLEASKDTIVVVMTGNPSVTTSIEALRAGAWDYLPKPFSATHLQVLVGRASHAVMVARETRDLRVQLSKQSGNSDKITLLGVSPAFRKAVELARKVASTDASVMIMGESGTGKEVIAQFIHAHSRRASRPMVPINCAALPEGLLESELFGHRKGAFTGADRDKPGLLEIANGGTLFLDELTEMSLPLQAKLLRVIQDGVVRRVGSEKEDAVVDVRFLSATNRTPQECVAKGTLREDLLYRLRVVPIHLPPLRKRPEDIPLLTNHFLTHYWERHRGTGEAQPRVSESAIEFLRSRPWRGNVRELQNCIERAVILSDGDTLQPRHLNLTSSLGESPAGVTADVQNPWDGIDLSGSLADASKRVLADVERLKYTRALAESGGNGTRAAELLQVPFRQFTARVRELGLS